MNLRLFFLSIVIPLYLVLPKPYASEIVPSTLEYMTDFSDTIVVGHVANNFSYWEGDKIFTRVTIEVERFVKNRNAESSSIIDLKIPGGKVGNISFEVNGAPVFELGEKIMLFLKRGKDAYFPFGLNYGVFAISWEETREKAFINGPLFNTPKHYDISTMTERDNLEPLGRKEFGPFLEKVKKIVK